MKAKEKRLAIKFFMCVVYLVIITILFVCAFEIFKEKKEITPWSEVETTDEYTYIDIYKMSEKFAYYEENNIGIHFVIEKEETGLWHTYIIAIDEKDYPKYKNIIDYTYERIKEESKPIRVYGYPVVIDNNIRSLAIKNLGNFVPKENEVKITSQNYDQYLTNSYLDTTKGQKETFSIVLLITLLLLVTVIGLLITTILDKDKIVDNIDNELEKLKQIKIK